MVLGLEKRHLNMQERKENYDIFRFLKKDYKEKGD
jgi:hypothetical protein